MVQLFLILLRQKRACGYRTRSLVV
ncbi:MAG: hypothetical protein AAAB20_08060 [Rhizobium sp.]